MQTTLKPPRYQLTRRRGFSLVCITGAAALAPALRLTVGESRDAGAGFPGWFETWEGRPLRRLPLGDREKMFTAEFPGPAALFSDGARLLLFRYTDRPAGTLRPAMSALIDAEFREFTPPREETDAAGRTWAVFDARLRWEQWTVREVVFDAAGESWPNVRSWYWASLLGASSGPWWSVVTFTPAPGTELPR